MLTQLLELRAAEQTDAEAQADDDDWWWGPGGDDRFGEIPGLAHPDDDRKADRRPLLWLVPNEED